VRGERPFAYAVVFRGESMTREKGPGAPPPGERAAEVLRGLLRYAVLAPSRHNAQPWLFEIEGPEARVYADVRRALHAADADGRELVLACGAALENLRLAARHAGFATTVELVAARAGGLVGRLRLEEPRPPDPAEEPLFDAISNRRTNRLAFEERPLPPGLVARLARTAADAGASLRVVEATARVAVAELVAEADHAQWENPRFRAEVAAWTRAPDAKAEDGVPGYARGLKGAASLLDRVLLRFASHGAPEERRDRQHLRHTPSLLALCTAADAPRDWALAGVAFERVLLHAAAAGLSASYYSAAIEVLPVRERLRLVLGETGFPQVLFRVGYGPEVRATPRRAPAAVLRALREGAPPPAALVPRR
jgi:hypothetical protein